MSEKPLYEFNLDDMTIGDWLLLINASNPATNGEVARNIQLSKHYTNTDVDALPLSEMENYLSQFYAAVNTHMKDTSTL